MWNKSLNKLIFYCRSRFALLNIYINLAFNLSIIYSAEEKKSHRKYIFHWLFCFLEILLLYLIFYLNGGFQKFSNFIYQFKFYQVTTTKQFLGCFTLLFLSEINHYQFYFFDKKKKNTTDFDKINIHAVTYFVNYDPVWFVKAIRGWNIQVGGYL